MRHLTLTSAATFAQVKPVAYGETFDFARKFEQRRNLMSDLRLGVIVFGTVFVGGLVLLSTGLI